MKIGSVAVKAKDNRLFLETGLIGGVEKREIKIVEYNRDWPNKFEKHAKIIADAIGTAASYAAGEISQ